jgi:hypothetical protein
MRSLVSRHQNAAQNHITQMCHVLFENRKLKDLKRTAANQTYIHEEIISRLNLFATLPFIILSIICVSA